MEDFLLQAEVRLDDLLVPFQLYDSVNLDSLNGWVLLKAIT